MSRSPIEIMIDRAAMQCSICEAPAGTCDCWERCPGGCGWMAMTAAGEKRADSLHATRGCGNPKCRNRRTERGCPAVWWHRRDEGKLCVLPIGHKGRHRYTKRPAAGEKGRGE